MKNNNTVGLGKLEAIGYLLENGSLHEDWAQAALLRAVIKVYDSRYEIISLAKLDALINDAVRVSDRDVTR